MGSLSIQDFMKRQGTETAQVQAQRIFNELSKDAYEGKKIALIYSANQKQAAALDPKIDAKTPMVPINGHGQAEVFHHLIKLINASQNDGLKSIRILPISTSLNGGSNGLGNTVSSTQVRKELQTVKAFIHADYDVIGIPDTNSARKGQFAIGGGVSAHWFETGFAFMVDPTNPVNDRGLNKISQGEFVQRALTAMKDNQLAGEYLVSPKPALDQLVDKLVNARTNKDKELWKEAKKDLVDWIKMADKSERGALAIYCKGALNTHFDQNKKGEYNGSAWCRLFQGGNTSSWHQVEGYVLKSPGK